MNGPRKPDPQGNASITLALWGDAWLRGAAAPDDVIGAMARWAEMHLAAAADEQAVDATGLALRHDPVGVGAVGLLRMLRRLGPRVRMEVVLPVAGDVTGTVPGTEHAAAALAAGESLLVHPMIEGTESCAGCIGMVPRRESGEVLRWTAYATGCGGTVVRPPSLGQARQTLREAVRESTDLLGGLGRVGGGGTDARREVAWRVEDAHVGPLPPDVSRRVCDAFDSATTVAAIVSVISDRTAGTPHSGSMSAVQESTLRRLSEAVRAARRAATAQALDDARRRVPEPAANGDAAAWQTRTGDML